MNLEKPWQYIRNQIDYILIRERFRNALKSCKTYPAADCGSNHIPVIAKVQLKLIRKLKKKKQNKKLDIGLQQLKLKEEIRIKYAVKVSNRLQALAEVEDLDEQWKIMKESITTAAKKAIPVVKNKSRKGSRTWRIVRRVARSVWKRMVRNISQKRWNTSTAHDICLKTCGLHYSLLYQRS